MDKKELVKYRKTLEKEHSRIVKSITDLENNGSLNRERNSDLVGITTHPADLGTDEYNKELNTQKMLRMQALLLDIDEALERIEDGIYGVCEATGEPITRERLRAKPWARYSLEHERQISG